MCKACDDIIRIEIEEFAPHNGSLLEEIEATCAAGGYGMYSCSSCGETYIRYIPAKGHKITNKTPMGSSCSFSQIYSGVCADCGVPVFGAFEKGQPEHSYDENGICTLCGADVNFSYCYDNFYGGIAIEGYNGASADVVVPDTIEGIPVKMIKSMHSPVIKTVT